MRLIVLGSSSKGNGYILTNGQESLLIEAGLPFKEYTKHVDYNTIKGAIVSHSHGDHAKYVSEFVKYNIDVYGASDIEGVTPCKKARLIKIGGFYVRPFPTKHDVECWMYHIRYDMNTFLFATDTPVIKYEFDPTPRNLLLEANFDEDVLQRNVELGIVSSSQAERIKNSHMSIETCLRSAMRMGMREVNNLILLHLSARNSQEAEFIDKARERGFKRAYVAKNGLELELTTNPISLD